MARETAGQVILLLGAAGQLGRELAGALGALGRVIAADRTVADLSDTIALRRLVRSSGARVIVNAAAYTAVDRAESEPALAHAINAVAPGVLAEEAEASGACLVHYSTDYVFDGRKAGPYTEEDEVAPLQVYGRTKLAGERAVMSACRRHLVLRTSWVVAAQGHNFVRTMLRLGAEREELRIVADQVGAPTSVQLIASATLAALTRSLDAGVEPAWGAHHLTASGSTSWHGLARHVIARAHEAGVPLRATPASVVPITTAEYPVPAARPANSRLDCSRFQRAFEVALPEWTVGVDDIIRSLAPSLQPTSPS